MSDEDPTRRPEPAWLRRLAIAGANAQRARIYRQNRYGSQGAASEARQLVAWHCACGWTGGTNELRLEPRTAALACPRCDGTGGLTASERTR
jgi:hypothetical protein